LNSTKFSVIMCACFKEACDVSSPALEVATDGRVTSIRLGGLGSMGANTFGPMTSVEAVVGPPVSSPQVTTASTDHGLRKAAFLHEVEEACVLSLQWFE